MRVVEIDARTRTHRHESVYGNDWPLGGDRYDPESCELRITFRCTPAEAQAVLAMGVGQHVDVRRSPLPKERQVPEQGEPEVVECEVIEARALPPRSES